MPDINVALIGHRFMGKAHSNAYRQVRSFFPGKFTPRMKVLCGKAPMGNWKRLPKYSDGKNAIANGSG